MQWTRQILKTACKNRLSHVVQQRHLWQWINIIFNKVDVDRKKAFGPDRTCAEWLLRNGAKVRWRGSDELLDDYNKLPPEGTLLHIEEVDASGSSIMHYGFPHFEGCKHIETVILHNCKYLEDPAFEMMQPLKDTLHFLQVSSCGNITEKGLNEISILTNLRTLVLLQLLYVNNKESVLTNLQSKIPNCKITFE